MAKRFMGGEIVSDVAPAGSVTAFAGTDAPDGWILCQGQELSIEDYPELHAAIGDGWNTATNPTSGSAYAAPAAGSFRLPDLRGSFLRGAGSPHTGDTCSLAGHQSQKTAKNGLGLGWLTGRNVGTGTGSGKSRVTVAMAGSAANGTWSGHTPSRTNSLAGGSRSDYPGQDHTHSWAKSNLNTDQSWAEDTETRPLNQGVNYIIKY